MGFYKELNIELLDLQWLEEQSVQASQWALSAKSVEELLFDHVRDENSKDIDPWPWNQEAARRLYGA